MVLPRKALLQLVACSAEAPGAAAGYGDVDSCLSGAYLGVSI